MCTKTPSRLLWAWVCSWVWFSLSCEHRGPGLAKGTWLWEEGCCSARCCGCSANWGL